MRPPLEFFVAGFPAGQPRVKATAFGGHARVYTPTTVKTANGIRKEHPSATWKMIVRNEADKAWLNSGNAAPWQGPLRVDLTFYLPRPKAHYRANGELKPGAPVFCESKPDRDNADKAVLDALGALGLFHDDKQVCQGWLEKRWANGRPGCRIVVQEAACSKS